MSQEEILMELKTIRTLLAIDKEERLNQLTTGLSDIQKHMIRELEFAEWISLSSGDIAEEFGCGTTKVSDHRTELVESNLVAKKGQGSGAKYRKTGLLRCANQIGVLNV